MPTKKRKICGSKRRQKQLRDRHEFSELTEFDDAMHKLVDVPKEEVAKREESERTPREK